MFIGFLYIILVIFKVGFCLLGSWTPMTINLHEYHVRIPYYVLRLVVIPVIPLCMFTFMSRVQHHESSGYQSRLYSPSDRTFSDSRTMYVMYRIVYIVVETVHLDSRQVL